MQSLLRLNLQTDSAKADAPNPSGSSNPEERAPEPVVMGKRVSQVVNRAAHRAASHSARQGSGIFSK